MKIRDRQVLNKQAQTSSQKSPFGSYFRPSDFPFSLNSRTDSRRVWVCVYVCVRVYVCSCIFPLPCIGLNTFCSQLHQSFDLESSFGNADRQLHPQI